MIYNNIIKKENIVKKINPSFNINFINGAFVEVTNAGNKIFDVKFINKSNNVVEYEGKISNNSWIKTNKSYYVDWLIEIYDKEDNILYNADLNLEDENVLIVLDSKSLGDNIAWFPYVDEFRKKHNCNVICSTFWNNLFKDQYPEITFVEPGENVEGIKARYMLGWFYDGNKPDYFRNPVDFRNQPMQKTSSDILGLEYKEIKPKIKLNKKITHKDKIVSIAIHGTAQTKYWNNPKGWQELVDYLNEKGYKVILLSQEHDGFMGNSHPKGIIKLPTGPIENVIETLQTSTLFIGIGSGLSWLSWATNIPTVIISGFSEPYTETQENTIRISTPEGKCTGCFNSHKLDAGDWNWCPLHKNTKRQFECSKSITSQQVINSIKHLI